MDLPRIANMVACPVATKDSEINSANRQKAVDEAFYGPININDTEYWNKLSQILNVPVEDARKSLCGNCGVFDITQGMLTCIGKNSEGLGYCRIYQFTCSAKRTCTAWVPDGPITDRS